MSNTVYHKHKLDSLKEWIKPALSPNSNYLAGIKPIYRF